MTTSESVIPSVAELRRAANTAATKCREAFPEHLDGGKENFAGDLFTALTCLEDKYNATSDADLGSAVSSELNALTRNLERKMEAARKAKQGEGQNGFH